MADKSTPRGTPTREQWAAQIAALDGSRRAPGSRRTPLSVARIVEAAFGLVAAEGFEALTMRRVAAALRTSPASLYVHVENKLELDGLMISELCARVKLPVPEPAQWREQFIDVCRQLRDQYLRYPGISRATAAAAPNNLDTLRIYEGMLAILLAAGVAPRKAAWAMEASFLYIGAYSFEESQRRQFERDADGRVLDQAELIERFKMLPEKRFPNMVAHAPELLSSEGHDRFEFTLATLLAGLAPAAALPQQGEVSPAP